MIIQSYRDLAVWQKAMDLLVDCYRFARKFPRAEQFGLTLQLRRAVLSISSNIAEGRTRYHTREFIQHLGIAHGSLAETENCILAAQRLEYLTKHETSQLLNQCCEIGRMLNGLRASLVSKMRRPAHRK